MHDKQYRAKLTGADLAVELIDSGETIVHAMAAGEPPALLKAIADRARAGLVGDLKIWSLLPMKHARETVLAPDLKDAISAFTWFVSASDRGSVISGIDQFVPNEFHQVPRFCRDYLNIDTVVAAVSSMDRFGYFTFGTVNDYITTAARLAKKIIVEVNPNVPRVFGDSLLHISEVTAVVENTADLIEIIPNQPKKEAAVIGRLVSELVPDEATIQLGLGGIPDAVTEYLSDHRDLGVHTELFCPGMVKLIEQGAITGRKKVFHRRKHIFTNAIGDARTYEFLNDNPSAESYPVSYTNDPQIIARNPNMISINSTIEVDLLGQCNSEYLDGFQFSGTGGQLDFVRGAYRSEGGKSIIAFYSTAKGGRISRIVPSFHPGTVVTTPRMDTHILATEYGVADLKGKTTRDRALAVISLAHPDFRDGLIRAGEEMRII